VQVRNETRLAGRQVKGHHRILVIRPVLSMIGSALERAGHREAAGRLVHHRAAEHRGSPRREASIDLPEVRPLQSQGKSPEPGDSRSP
jgi:hypothetical protein